MTGYYENLTVGNIIVNEISGVPTPSPYDVSANLATTQYVTTQTRQSMGTVVLSNIVGGTYSFNCMGSSAEIDYTAVDGTITSINAIVIPGSNYAIGDIVTVDSGKYEALKQAYLRYKTLEALIGEDNMSKKE